jgi:hypothetical protein
LATGRERAILVGTMRGFVGRIAWLCLVASVACASTPTLDDFNADRSLSLSRTSGHRVATLRAQILSDGAACAGELQFMTFYLLAPPRVALGEDYVALGDALANASDADGAVSAYEDAVMVADGRILSAEAAARVRLAALRGEQRLWETLGQPPRATAAKLVADAQEAWLATPEAQEAKGRYGRQLAESESAKRAAVAVENQATWTSINESMNEMQQTMQTYQQSQNMQHMSPQQQQQAMAQQISQMTPQLVELAEKTATLVVKALDLKIDPRVFEVLHEIADAAPPLVEAVRSGKVEKLLDTPEGKSVLGGVVDVLHALRRGDSMELVQHLTDDVAAAAKKLEQKTPAATTAVAVSLDAGAPAATGDAGKPDVGARLKELQRLFDEKLITDEDYKRERERILKEGL